MIVVDKMLGSGVEVVGMGVWGYWDGSVWGPIPPVAEESSVKESASEVEQKAIWLVNDKETGEQSLVEPGAEVEAPAPSERCVEIVLCSEAIPKVEDEDLSPEQRYEVNGEEAKVFASGVFVRARREILVRYREWPLCCGEPMGLVGRPGANAMIFVAVLRCSVAGKEGR